MNRRILLYTLAGFALFIPSKKIISSAYAESARTSIFRTSQLYVALPKIIIWADAKNSQKETVTGLKPANFKAKIGESQLLVEKVLAPGQYQRSIAYVAMLDTSRSMKGKPIRFLKQATRKMIEQLRPNDQMALISFGSKVKIRQGFTKDKSLLLKALKTIKANESKTKIFEALREALDLLNRRGTDFPKRKAILIVSDGNSDGDGLTLNDLTLNKQRPFYPILAVGYSKKRRERFTTLKRLSALSRGSFIQSPKPRQLVQKINALIKEFHQAYEVWLSWPRNKAEAMKKVLGKRKNINIRLIENTSSFLSDQKVILYGKPFTALKKPAPKTPWALMAGLGGGFLSLFFLAFFLFRKKETEEPSVDVQLDDSLDQPALEPSSIEEPNLAPLEATTPSFQPTAIVRFDLMTSHSHTIPQRDEHPIPRQGITLGRTGDVRVIDDTEISGIHCKLVVDGGWLWLEDLDSRNGTVLNGVTVVGQQRVESGDVIIVGQTKIRLELMRIV